MRVYLNREPVLRPWGGGAKTIKCLVDEIESRGHEVVFHLGPGIDRIFCMDPRPNDYGEEYSDLLNYRSFHGVPIIQRVGDVGTHSKPELTHLVKKTVAQSDLIIFISEWAKNIIGYRGGNSYTIKLHAPRIFHNFKRNDRLLQPVKIITHHWSTNKKKGIDLYRFLDRYLSQDKRFSFTYLGQLPEGVNFKNIRHIKPLESWEDIARLLSSHDVYLSASIDEAGGNHIAEAKAAGLPIVYHIEGGGIAEYAKDFGVGFSCEKEVVKCLEEVVSNYAAFKSQVLKYNSSLEGVCSVYANLIIDTDL